MRVHGGVLQKSQPVRRVIRDVDLAARSGAGAPHVFLHRSLPRVTGGRCGTGAPGQQAAQHSEGAQGCCSSSG